MIVYFTRSRGWHGIDSLVSCKMSLDRGFARREMRLKIVGKKGVHHDSRNGQCDLQQSSANEKARQVPRSAVLPEHLSRGTARGNYTGLENGRLRRRGGQVTIRRD